MCRNIFEYIVNRHPELAALRDGVMGKQRGPFAGGQNRARTPLRSLVDSGERAAHGKRSWRCSLRTVDIEQNRPREEREVMHLACLVDRDAQKGLRGRRL